MRKLLNSLIAFVVLVTGVGIGMTVRLSSMQASAQGGCQTFPATGKTVCGRFTDYWQTHGAWRRRGIHSAAQGGGHR